MRKKLFFCLLSFSTLSVCSQERLDLINKHFIGAINKIVVGDSISSMQSMKIRFLKDKAIIEEERLSVTKKPRLIYKVEVAWRINKRNNQVIFSAANKNYSYQDYNFYFREQFLKGVYIKDDDKVVVLDINFAETE